MGLGMLVNMKKPSEVYNDYTRHFDSAHYFEIFWNKNVEIIFY